MQSASAAEHLWPTQAASQQDGGDTTRLPVITAASKVVGGQSNGGGPLTGASASTASKQMLSSPLPPRQASPSYLTSAIASSSSNNSSPLDSIAIASSSSAQGYQPSTDDYSSLSFSSQRAALGSSAAASNSSEDFFFQRDPLFLPRRNHTIGGGTLSNRRRLNSHFQFPSQGPTSPGQNSLSAITGGEDIDDDEWESMIKSRDKLVPGEDDREEVPIGVQTGSRRTAAASTSSASAWQPDPFLTSHHHRFPSQPSSVQAASPYYTGAHSPESSIHTRSALGHQRSESAHVRSLEQGPFASASIIATSPNSLYDGMIRRHQSLNHATGRAMANRLQASTRRDRSGERQSIDRRSPVAIFDQSSSQSVSPGVPLYHDRGGRETPETNLPHSSNMLSPSIMDAHARLLRMTIQPNSAQQPIREDFVDTTTGNDVDALKRLPSLITNRDVLERSAGFNSQGKREIGAPFSAAAYVPPIGHGHHRSGSSSSVGPVTAAMVSKNEVSNRDSSLNSSLYRGPYSAVPTSNAWTPQQSSSSIGKPGLNQNFGTAREEQQIFEDTWAHGPKPPTSIDNNALNMAIFQQNLLQQQSLGAAAQFSQQQALHHNVHSAALFHAANHQSGPLDMRRGAPPAMTTGPLFNSSFAQSLAPPSSAPPSISPALASLIAARGYNPSAAQFDLKTFKARFFVIKSFTEDDVQRSLKYEIWASTDKGNQRLDKAYKECEADGNTPLYLFFSVNASGHFCGMAQMMTALDYNSTSNVWVQEGKWKGIFKVKWIYVKDVPNVKLRHIILTNTAERKPITQSRDTQELPLEGGKEVLRIMAEFQSRTTLLQDWLFYEQQAVQQQQRKDVPPNSTTFEATRATTQGA